MQLCFTQTLHQALNTLNLTLATQKSHDMDIIVPILQMSKLRLSKAETHLVLKE